jgi:hypothetical protein
MYMNRFISAVSVLFLIQQVAVALPAQAQSGQSILPQQSNTQAFTPAAPATVTVQNAQAASDVAQTSGPTLAASRVGIAPDASGAATGKPTTVDPHVGAGQNVALMLVGGAGLITGLLIGGNGGAAIAIGGAIVGLYGLYKYIQ